MIFAKILVGVLVPTFVCGLAGYQQYGLNMHNNYRSLHGSAPLGYNDKLSELAFLCAKYYAQIGRIDHSCNYKFGYGENLAFFGHTSGSPYTLNSVTDAINGWYFEKYDYNYWQPRSSTSTNVYHFTQMVWKSTFQMGIAAFRDENSRRTYVVALYYPKGNMLQYGPPDPFNWFRGNVTTDRSYVNNRI